MAKPKTALSVLIAARKLISNPEKWTTGAFARNGRGRQVEPIGSMDEATCFCAHGAIIHAAGGYNTDSRQKAYWALADAANTTDFPGPWNDRSEHRDVLATFDCAIANLRKEKRTA